MKSRGKRKEEKKSKIRKEKMDIIIVNDIIILNKC